MCENENSLSGNPSICASCTSLAAGMDDARWTGLIESDETAQEHSPDVLLLFQPAELDAKRRIALPGAHN